MSGMFCRFRPLLASPIPQRQMEIEQPHLIEAQPELSPAQHVRQRSPANSRPANMAANPPKIGIPPTAARWFQWCRPALNPLKGIYSIRLRPSGHRGWTACCLKSSQKASALTCSLAKTAIGSENPPLSPLASLFSAPWLSHQGQAIIQELFHLKIEAPTGAGVCADLRERSVPRKALSDELAASDIAR